MLIEHLKSELANRREKNPRYSLRAYARSLEIDSATLSSLLNGKRPLSVKTAKQLLDKLPFDLGTKRTLLMATINDGQRLEARAEYLVLDRDTLEIVSSWEHYAILSLLETKGAKLDPKWISEKIGITPAIVKDALARLQRVGLVKKSGKSWRLTGKPLTTSHDIPNTALRQANRQYIQKAIHSLDNHSVEDRDITGITMAISRRKLPEAKKLIQEFRRSLCNFLEEGKKDEVYRLNLQLFPVRP